ncbi:MAG: hypothetical protein GX628_05550 [Clostridiales bacterium]|nr:hypothetical protein [Clostridiales bacterium]
MIYNITDFGAKADGSALCTGAIQAAIDACGVTGGVVNIPAGRYITGTLWLRDNVELHLEHGAVLRASSDLADYNETSDYPQNFDCEPEGWCGKHLIIAHERTNVAISGGGVIEGAAEAFYGGARLGGNHYSWQDGYYQVAEGAPLRPGQIVCFIECSHVRVTDITLRNGTCWYLFFHGCEYVQVRGVKIFGHRTHANTDGIDIDSSRYVTVSDCIIDTGDDAIAIRGDAKRLSDPGKVCEYVSISNCVLSTSVCAFRVGVGTGRIRFVNISDINIPRSGQGLGFMTGWKGRGCVPISDMVFRNITGDDVGIPLTMNANEAEISRITFDGYRTGCKCCVSINGNRGAISDIVLRNVELTDIEHEIKTGASRGDAIFNAREVRNLTVEGLKLNLIDSYYDTRPREVNTDGSTLRSLSGSYTYRGEEHEF